MERKAFDNFVASLSDGTLVLQMQTKADHRGRGSR